MRDAGFFVLQSERQCLLGQGTFCCLTQGPARSPLNRALDRKEPFAGITVFRENGFCSISSGLGGGLDGQTRTDDEDRGGHVTVADSRDQVTPLAITQIDFAKNQIDGMQLQAFAGFFVRGRSLDRPGFLRRERLANRVAISCRRIDVEDDGHV